MSDVMTFRMDPDYRRRLEAEADAHGLTLSAHIRSILVAHGERTEIKTVLDVVKILAAKVQALESEIRQFRKDFQDAIE
jgi:outer membrane murein-binding lipoprotein Lpp